jgi:hypothetical protein
MPALASSVVPGIIFIRIRITTRFNDGGY